MNVPQNMDENLLREVLNNRETTAEALKAAKEIVAKARKDSDREIARIGRDSMLRREEQIAEESARITEKTKRENRFWCVLLTCIYFLMTVWFTYIGDGLNAAIFGVGSFAMSRMYPKD